MPPFTVSGESPIAYVPNSTMQVLLSLLSFFGGGGEAVHASLPLQLRFPIRWISDPFHSLYHLQILILNNLSLLWLLLFYRYNHLRYLGVWKVCGSLGWYLCVWSEGHRVKSQSRQSGVSDYIYMHAYFFFFLRLWHSRSTGKKLNTNKLKGARSPPIVLESNKLRTISRFPSHACALGQGQ